MPDDLQIVQPEPLLPKELAAFWGKWDWFPAVLSNRRENRRGKGKPL
jgi:hypothetical protein